jgi:MFS family permease
MYVADNCDSLQRRTTLFTLSYGLALLGSVVCSMTPTSVTLALRIAELDPRDKNASYALAIGIGTVVMLVAAPLAGQLSDATSSRMGMRRPWIALGAVGTVLAAFLLARAATVPGVIAAWTLMALFISLGFSPLMAVIQDQFPQSQQGVASGLAGTTPLLGNTLGAWIVQLLPQTPAYMFVVPAAVGSLMLLQFTLVLNDRQQAAGRLGFNLSAFIRGFYFDPRANASFAWALLVIILSSIGVVVLESYMVYMLQDSVRIPTDQLARVTFEGLAAANIVGAGFSLVGGALSDLLGKRKLLYVIGTVVLAVGLAGQAMSTHVTSFLVSCVIAGTGYGLFTGLTWALGALSSTDPTTSARDMGLVSVALTLPSLIVPFIAPFVIRLGAGNNYAALYLLCAGATVLAIPALVRVRSVQ